MKKKLNTDAITNELSEGSAFFQATNQPVEEPTKAQTGIQETGRDTERTDDRPVGRTAERSGGRSVGRSIKRIRVRRGFEFYQDQLQKLKELQLNAALRGDELSMSDIVRRALDAYLEKVKLQ